MDMDHSERTTENLENMEGPHWLGDKVNLNLLKVYVMANIILTAYHNLLLNNPHGRDFSWICRWPVTFEDGTSHEQPNQILYSGCSETVSFKPIIFPLYHIEELGYQNFGLIYYFVFNFFTIELDEICDYIYSVPPVLKRTNYFPLGYKKQWKNNLMIIPRGAGND